MSAPNTHRGWSISFDYPPIPIRSFDYSATHPDYDGEGDDRMVTGETLQEVKDAIDDWYCEQSGCDGEGRIWNNGDPTSGQFVPCEECGDTRGHL